MTNKEFCEYTKLKNTLNESFTVLNNYVYAKQYKNKDLVNTIELLDKKIHQININYDKDTLYNGITIILSISGLIISLINNKQYKSKKDLYNLEYYTSLNKLEYNKIVNYSDYYIDLITDSLEMVNI